MKRIPRSVLGSRSPLLSLPNTRPRHCPIRARPLTQTRTATIFNKSAGPVDVQHVVVRSRWLTLKRVGTYTLSTGLSATLLVFLVSFLFLDDDEEEGDEDAAADLSLVASNIREANQGDAIGAEESQGIDVNGDGSGKGVTMPGSEEEQEQEDEDDDLIPDETPEGAWFIPLGPVKALPRVLYKSSDPEWQEFAKFGRNPERRRRVEKELQGVLLTAISHNPKIRQIMGGDITFRRSWLTVDFPPGPPPEYEQLGIEWAPGYVAILYRIRPQGDVNRIARAMWPETVASSAYSTVKDLFNTQFARAKKALGLEEQTSTPSQLLGLPVSMQAQPNSKTPQAQNESPKTVSEAGKERKGKTDPKVQVDLLSVLPDYPQDPNVKEAITLFKKKLARKWRPAGPGLTPGTIGLQGMIEYQGPNATCIVDVVAGYSVMDNKFNVVRASIRRLAPRVYRPQG